jgi:hypothetical protein
MARKCNNTESEQRTNAVYDLLLRAHSRKQIIQFAAENWGIGDRQVDSYIARARELLSADAKMERSQWLEAAIARAMEYERRAADKDQLNTALIALDKQARLLRFEMS